MWYKFENVISEHVTDEVHEKLLCDCRQGTTPFHEPKLTMIYVAFRRQGDSINLMWINSNLSIYAFIIIRTFIETNRKLGDNQYFPYV